MKEGDAMMTAAKICFAVVVCIPLLLCVNWCFEKLVNQINKKKRSDQ